MNQDGPGRRHEASVTLLGFTVPTELIQDVLAVDSAMPIQTHTFAWSVVNALRAAGCRVTLLSTLPVSTYPNNPKILLRSQAFVSNGVDGMLLGFVNLLGIKHVTRFLNACRLCPAVFDRSGSRTLLIHGVHTPFLWYGVLARRRGLTVVPILTDPPGIAGPNEGRLLRFLRRMDVLLVKSALRRLDGVVALTNALAEDFAGGRPNLVVDGILNPPAISPRGSGGCGCTGAIDRPFSIAYAGGLSRAYGIDRLVEAVHGIPDANIQLLVFGRGELEDWISSRSAVDRRIRPPEFLPRQLLAVRLADVDVLVNPRPIDQGFVRHSFPSKLIEYMSVGRPVVTTRLPGIPADYHKWLIFSETDAVDDIRSAINRVRAMPPEEADSIGSAGAAFIRRTRNASTQGHRIRRFLSQLPPPVARHGTRNGV
jgi:glycosyltransferase involved in cell wall biosynthesis